MKDMFKPIQQKCSTIQTFITKNLIDKNRVILVFFAALCSAFIAWEEYSFILGHTTQQPWKQLINNTSAWSLTTAIISLPIALVLWIFRDNNQLKQIENQRKDVNLKDFQKVSEWVSGINLIEDKQAETTKITSIGAQNNGDNTEEKTNSVETYKIDKNLSKKDGALALQVAAIYQLQAFINGEYGEYFRRPAFQLIKTMWLKLAEQYKDDPKAQQKLINLPLGRATNRVIRETIENIANDFPKELQYLQLPYINLTELENEQKSSAENKKLLVDTDGIKLPKAKLQFAVLLRADLSKAELSEADLRGADLRGADLSEADLSEADLRGATLINIEYDSKTDFSNAKTNNHTRVEIQDKNGNILEKETRDLKDKLGMQTA